MSEEIVFADMLNHYSLKITEISDMLNQMVLYLNKCVDISRESWQSATADKFVFQISNMKHYINEANAAMDELMKLFNAVKNSELDVSIQKLENRTQND